MLDSKRNIIVDNDDLDAPPPRISSFFKTLAWLLGFVSIILSLWAAMITAWFVVPNMITLFYLDGYTSEIFTIEEVRYVQGIQSQRTIDKSWIEGTVTNRREKFYKLGDYIEGTIQNLEAMEAQLKIGQKLPVLYNPNVPAKHEVRVLYPDENFYVAQKKKREQFIMTAYYPLAVSLLLCLLCGILAGERRLAIGFLFGSLFLPGFVWGISLINWFT